MTEIEIAYERGPWHDDYLLDEEENIVVRIDDDTVSWVTAWAVGEDINGLCLESQEPDTYDAFYDQTIAYWCDRISAESRTESGMPPYDELFYDENGHPNFSIYDHLARGGKFIIHNCINNREYELTKELLVDGIKQALHERYADCDFDIETMLSEQYLEYDEDAGVYKLSSPDNRWYDFGDDAFQLALFDDLYYNHECLRMFGAIRVYIPAYQPFAN